MSLTVLGQVIMSLVDVQHGRRQHVPYRNSRLTFLLQVQKATSHNTQSHSCKCRVTLAPQALLVAVHDVIA